MKNLILNIFYSIILIYSTLYFGYGFWIISPSFFFFFLNCCQIQIQHSFHIGSVYEIGSIRRNLIQIHHYPVRLEVQYQYFIHKSNEVMWAQTRYHQSSNQLDVVIIIIIRDFAHIVILRPKIRLSTIELLTNFQRVVHAII